MKPTFSIEALNEAQQPLVKPKLSNELAASKALLVKNWPAWVRQNFQLTQQQLDALNAMDPKMVADLQRTVRSALTKNTTVVVVKGELPGMRLKPKSVAATGSYNPSTGVASATVTWTY